MTDYKNAKICPNQVTFKNETPEEILVLRGSESREKED